MTGRRSGPSWLEGFQRMQTVRSAVASVSLSHEESCDCLTCRAAAGDDEAFLRIYEDMLEREAK